MDNKNISKTIKILLNAGVLKDVKRTGWVIKGVKNVESVADHTWRMSLLIMLLAPKNLDKQKLLEMNTVHDLGEIGVGDIKWETGKKIIGSQKVKHEDEMKAMNQIFGGYSDSKKYTDLLNEFNEQKTKESKFLKQIDKLEMALQAYEYEKGNKDLDLDEFWENAEKYLKGKELEPFFRVLQKMRKK